MKQILITGGAGFIGSHLCEALLQRDHQILCLDNFNDYYDPKIKRDNLRGLLGKANYQLVEGDILDQGFLRQVFESTRIDTIVHLAARAGVRPSIQDPPLYQKVNVQGTVNLLEAAKDFGVQKFIFASSSSVYGRNKKVPFSEADVVDHPISPYAASKKAGELVCYTYHHLYALPVTCLRFFTVYGPRQRPDMAIHKFTKRIFQQDKIALYGDGRSRRDYTYITDIIQGICKSIDRCTGYHIYNLGESKTIELLTLVELISTALGKKADIGFLPQQAGDVPVTFADISKAREELGYRPQVEIEQGIEKFVRWFTDFARFEHGKEHPVVLPTPVRHGALCA